MRGAKQGNHLKCDTLQQHFHDVCLGARTLPSRQVTEWTTPSKKRFTVSVSPYIACVEAMASDSEDDKGVEETTSVSHTSRVQSSESKTKWREKGLQGAKAGNAHKFHC